MTNTSARPPFYPFTRVSRGRNASLRDAEEVDRLYKSIRRGMFTPVFGAGCSSLGRENHGRSEIVAAMCSLEGQLDAYQKAYLWSVFPPQWDRSSVTSSAPETLTWQPLRDLQVALVKLGAQAVSLFGAGIEKLGGAVLDANEHEVRLPEPGMSTLRELLSEATTRAREFDNAVQKSSPYQQGQRPLAWGIYEGLRHLTNLFFDSVLPIGALEWLGQVLWYTFRFPLEMLPTTADLALQVALERSRQSTDPTDLASAAEVMEYREIVAKIREWFAYYSPEQTAGEFYQVMAALLRWLYDQHETPGQARSPQPAGLEATAPPPDAIAFTTNFDRELEQAFDTLKDQRHRPYHIVFPVYALGRDAEGHPRVLKPAPVWVFRTVKPIQSSPASGDFVCGDAPPYSSELEGPIIVKLHGAPLEELPRLRTFESLQERPTDTAHYLVLAESDYLYDVVATTLPGWLQQVLSSNRRSLWFLGHSVSDWNIRLRLYGSMQGTSENVAPATDAADLVGRWAVNRKFDVFRTAILGSLGIVRVQGDLKEFENKIREARDDQGRFIVRDYLDA